MSVALLTPLWCRPEIEHLVLEYYADIATPCDELYAAYSEETQEETLDLAHELGWTLLPCPSAPLGAKLNAATQQLRYLTDASHVVLFGSDDLIHIDALAMLMEASLHHAAAGFEHCYVLDVLTWRMGHVVRPRSGLTRPTGAGRILRRQVMDELDWTLRNDDASVNLDGNLDARLSRLEISWKLLELDPKAPVVDVKTATNIHSFGAIISATARVRQVPPALVLSAFDRRWVRRLAELGQAHMDMLWEGGEPTPEPAPAEPEGPAPPLKRDPNRRTLSWG